MAADKTLRKIIWAVDVLEEPRMQQRAAEVLRSWANRGPLEVEAIYLPLLAHLRLAPVDFSGPWLEEYREQAEAQLTDLLKRHGLGDLGRAVMIERNFASTPDAVRCLSEYAREADADFILASTHGRSGLGRLLLGSFAETLLQHSEVPVLTIGPHSKGSLEMGTVFFPTDFAPSSRLAFRQVVALCSDLESNLVIYHAVHPSLEVLMYPDSFALTSVWTPAGMPAPSESASDHARAERRLRRWVAWAREQGVEARYSLQEGVGSVADAIMAQAEREKAGIIAIEAESGPMTAMLLGSVTRQVVRQSPCPVVVFRKQAVPKAALRAA